jgi:arylsulfatase A-like enzyme
MRKSNLKKLFVDLILLTGLPYACISGRDSEHKPNILLFIIDDAGYNDVGYNGSEIKTPVIDSLANQGVRLNSYYVYPVSSPTRAALLTGRPPSRIGILAPLQTDSPRKLKEEAILLSTVLKKAGYETCLDGKWHLGMSPEETPNMFGFDHSYGYLGPWLDSYTHFSTNWKLDGSILRQWHRNGKLFDESGHVTDLITDEAVSFIKEKRNKTKPFYLHVAYSAPHTPLQEPAKYTDIYKGSIENNSRRYYAAAMTHLDEGMGEIIEALIEEGIDENTIVIFMSDNGAAKGSDYSNNGKGWLVPPREFNMSYGLTDQLGNNSPFRDWKGSLYEGGIRVAAFITWPKHLKSSICDQTIYVCDWVPTLANLAGIELPSGMNAEGMNVVPALKGEKIKNERFLYWRTTSQQAVRRGPWKLIHTGKTLHEGKYELFNIDEDPFEKINLAEKYSDMVNLFVKEIERNMEMDPKNLD